MEFLTLATRENSTSPSSLGWLLVSKLLPNNFNENLTGHEPWMEVVFIYSPQKSRKWTHSLFQILMISCKRIELIVKLIFSRNTSIWRPKKQIRLKTWKSSEARPAKPRALTTLDVDTRCYLRTVMWKYPRAEILVPRARPLFQQPHSSIIPCLETSS
jgi:hypothetical protein